jgi:hypothetical protein
MRRLYFLGPEWNGFGFWQGRPHHEICSILTGVSGSDGNLWLKHSQNIHECEDMIQRKFTAFLVCCETIVFFFLFYKCVDYICFRWIYVNPMIRRIENLLQKYSPKRKEKC